MIPFISAQGLVEVRLACSKALLLTISSSDIVTHSLLENCPYSELFWSLFSPNAGKYGPE